MRPPLRTFGAFLFVAALAACTGGGGTSRGVLPVPTAAAMATAAVPLGSASLTITRSRSLSQARRLTYVSSATTNVAIAADNGGAPVNSSVVLATVCPSFATSGVCTFTVAAPVGTDTIKITASNGGGQPLSCAAVSGVTVAADVATVVPPVVLNPVAASQTVAPSSSVPYGSTTGVALNFKVYDASAMLTTSPGTYFNSSGVAIGLNVGGVWASDTTKFGSNSSCSGSVSVFAPATWSPAQTVYLCPGGDHSVGSAYQVTLGSTSTTFYVGYSNIGTGAGGTGVPPSSPPVVNDISGDEQSAVAAMTAIGSGNYLYLAPYTTGSSSWQYCSLPQPYTKVQYDLSSSSVYAVKQGAAYLDKFDLVANPITTGGGSCTVASTVFTGSDISGMLLRGAYIYSVNTDNGTVKSVRKISRPGLALSAGPASVGCFPHSIADDASFLYVGCSNSSNVTVYNPAALGLTNTLTTNASAAYGQVAGDPDRLTTAYAVVGGGGQNLAIYSLTSSAATLLYTFASSSDGLDSQERRATVGRDGQLYIVVTNGGVRRVVRYDPVANALTDPAWAYGLSDSYPAWIDRGYGGRIVGGGQLTSYSRAGFAWWPN